MENITFPHYFKWFSKSLIFSFFQEADGQKTNNGIQYRLQLLFANGKLVFS